MAWTKPKTATAVGAGIALAAGVVTIHQIKRHNDPVRAQVLEIIRTNANDRASAARMIAEIGPKALPTLEQLVRWKESTFGRGYARIWNPLPNGGLADTNELVRFAALKSLYALHLPRDKPLVSVLNTFTARRSTDFQAVLNWLGSLRENGREASAWLRQFAVSDTELEKLPEGVRAQAGWDIAIPSESLRQSAILAICRNDPSETREYLTDLLGQVGHRWEAVELLMDSRFLATKITDGLEPMLAETLFLRPALAAYVILGLKPDHKHALATLRNCVANGKLNDRVIAAKWLWKQTGETNDVLRLCIEGLAAPESHAGQNANSILRELGSEARSAIPALKAALWHSDTFVRHGAGKTLRKIAPEELPSIH
jgi:hypothetical protein